MAMLSGIVPLAPPKGQLENGWRQTPAQRWTLGRKKAYRSEAAVSADSSLDKLGMTLSNVEWIKALSGAEGQPKYPAGKNANLR